MDPQELVDMVTESLSRDFDLAAPDPDDTTTPPAPATDFTPPEVLSIGGRIEDVGINGRNDRRRSAEILTGLYAPGPNHAIIAGGTASHGTLLDWYLSEYPQPDELLGFKIGSSIDGVVYFEIPGGGGGLFQGLSKKGLNDEIRRLKGGNITSPQYLYECVYAARRFGIDGDAVVRYGHRVTGSADPDYNATDQYRLEACYRELRFMGHLPDVLGDEREQLSAPADVPTFLEQYEDRVASWAGTRDLSWETTATNNILDWTFDWPTDTPPAERSQRRLDDISASAVIFRSGDISEWQLRLPPIPSDEGVFDTRDKLSRLFRRATPPGGEELVVRIADDGPSYTPHVHPRHPQPEPEKAFDTIENVWERYREEYGTTGMEAPAVERDIEMEAPSGNVPTGHDTDGAERPDIESVPDEERMFTVSEATLARARRLARKPYVFEVSTSTVGGTGGAEIVDFIIDFPGDPSIRMPTDEAFRSMSKTSITFRDGEVSNATFRFPPVDPDVSDEVRDKWFDAADGPFALQSEDPTLFGFGNDLWPHVDWYDLEDTDATFEDVVDRLGGYVDLYKSLFSARSSFSAPGTQADAAAERLTEAIEEAGGYVSNVSGTTYPTIDFSPDGVSSPEKRLTIAQDGEFGSTFVARRDGSVTGTIRLGSLGLEEGDDLFLAKTRVEEIVQDSNPPAETSAIDGDAPITIRFRDMAGFRDDTLQREGDDILHIELNGPGLDAWAVASWYERFIPLYRERGGEIPDEIEQFSAPEPDEITTPQAVPSGWSPPTVYSGRTPIQPGDKILGSNETEVDSLVGMVFPERNETLVATQTFNHFEMLGRWFPAITGPTGPALPFKSGMSGVEVPGGGGGLVAAARKVDGLNEDDLITTDTVQPNQNLYDIAYTAAVVGYPADETLKFLHRPPGTTGLETIEYRMGDLYRELSFVGAFPRDQTVLEAPGDDIPQGPGGRAAETILDGIRRAGVTSASFEPELGQHMIEFYPNDQDPHYPSAITLDPDTGRITEVTIRFGPLGDRGETPEGTITDLEGKWVDIVLDAASEVGILDDFETASETIDLGDAWVAEELRPHVRLYQRDEGYDIAPQEMVDFYDTLQQRFLDTFGTLEDRMTGIATSGEFRMRAPTGGSTAQQVADLLEPIGMQRIEVTQANTRTAVDFVVPSFNETTSQRDNHKSSVIIEDGTIRQVTLRLPFLDRDVYDQRDLFGLSGVFNNVPLVEERLRGIQVRRADLAAGWAYHIERSYSDPRPTPRQLVAAIDETVQRFEAHVGEFEQQMGGDFEAPEGFLPAPVREPLEMMDSEGFDYDVTGPFENRNEPDSYSIDFGFPLPDGVQVFEPPVRSSMAVYETGRIREWTVRTGMWPERIGGLSEEESKDIMFDIMDTIHEMYFTPTDTGSYYTRLQDRLEEPAMIPHFGYRGGEDIMFNTFVVDNLLPGYAAFLDAIEDEYRIKFSERWFFYE